MTPLKVKWYDGRKGKVGIALVQTDDGDTEYRISAVDGFLEHMDVQQIVAWGASFPIEAGDALFLEGV
jgi:hypothetical protein